jgi:folate-dependent phosphoribosylglycinamide formyltransferase PurN
MKIVCFVSGSGTNYAQIVLKHPAHRYLVFSNRPGCGGTVKARQNGHELVELSHIPYLKAARARYGPGNVPRNCPEREAFEKEAFRLIEERLQGPSDLVCLAGYDQWTTDWLVDAHYPRLLNVHPGDTTRGYAGLGWVASARAILAGDDSVRSTLFVVDRGEDSGPVLIQSRPLSIVTALAGAEIKQPQGGLLNGLSRMKRFAGWSYGEFQARAGADDQALMKLIGETIQDTLKVVGDWEIYPYGVGLIGRGAVELEGRTVYIDGAPMPEHGYRMEQ